MCFPSKSDPFLKIYLLASLETHSAYYQAAGYTNRIKGKENYRQFNTFFCPGNISVKGETSFLQRQEQGRGRVSSCHSLFPLPSLFGGSECGTFALWELSLLIYHIAILSSPRTPVTIVLGGFSACTCQKCYYWGKEPYGKLEGVLWMKRVVGRKNHWLR